MRQSRFRTRNTIDDFEGKAFVLLGKFQRRRHLRCHHSSSRQAFRKGDANENSSVRAAKMMMMRGGGVSQRACYSYSSSSSSQKRQTISDKNQNMLYYLLAITSFTVGASYASVPLYRAFCRATGFGGTTQRKSIEDKMQEREQMDKSVLEKAKKRSIEITFNADVAEGLPWKFTPTQKKVTVTPGETVLAFYTAENTSSSAITGVATYNVQPGKAGQYFNKIQCFCFEEQRLRAKEKVDMPVFFYLDPEFASDRGMEDVNSLVLSYTFFQSEDFDGDEYDESRDDEKGGGGGGKEEGGVKLHGSGVGPDGRKL
jgi:cytochrome c oxidase assembly protein subunit 11